MTEVEPHGSPWVVFLGRLFKRTSAWTLGCRHWRTDFIAKGGCMGQGGGPSLCTPDTLDPDSGTCDSWVLLLTFHSRPVSGCDAGLEVS